ncbi:Rhs-family protein [Bacillus sp. ZZV12-4809]|nr:Rhs-family protein [Bacillus sp. ZZV12-4809]
MVLPGKKAGKGTDEIDRVLTKNGGFRDAKRRAGIPNSIQHKKPVDVYDGTTENRRVYEFEVDGKKKYIIEHREDKFGRGPHFHGADDLKGSPLEKGRYNQYPGHSPEDFVGYKKKGRP